MVFLIKVMMIIIIISRPEEEGKDEADCSGEDYHHDQHCHNDRHGLDLQNHHDDHHQRLIRRRGRESSSLLWKRDSPRSFS